MRKIKDDLIKLAQMGEFDVIVHGCNCVCVMESGIAFAIRQAFPQAYETDQRSLRGDFNKLGKISVALCPIIRRCMVYVVNAYIQRGVSEEEGLVDYDALSSCMQRIHRRFGEMRIGLPMIGSGLAGGDWNIIEKIIENELDGCDVTIVEYEK